MKKIMFEIKCNMLDIVMASLICVAILLAGMIIGATATKDSASVNTIQVEREVEYRMEPQYRTLEIIREVDRRPETELKDYEKELIACVVYAEADNQDMIGKRLVVDTILNRVGRAGFADTVSGVVYQPNQYCRAAMYTDECMQAVEMECMERLDYYVVWFCNSGFMPYGIPAYQHGGHWFSWIDASFDYEDIKMGAGAQEVIE